mgnify:CR=1 FL=1
MMASLPGGRRHAAAQAGGPPVLLLIGIHREELEFGRAAARGMDEGEVAVLEIPEGLSGRRPLPDDSFRYDALHRALYRQLPPHVVGRHRLLIDLHTGFDHLGPSADLICADLELLARLRRAIDDDPRLSARNIRLIPLGDADSTHARTVIPAQVWNNPAFRYLGMEIYLPEGGAQQAAALELARQLVHKAACIDLPAPPAS